MGVYDHLPNHKEAFNHLPLLATIGSKVIYDIIRLP